MELQLRRPSAFNAVTALIKILFMILGFLMAAGVDPDLARAAAVRDDAGPAGTEPRVHRAAVHEWSRVGHHPLPRRRDEVHLQGGLRPGKAHKFLFMWAPIMAMAPALIVAAIIPFGAPLCWGEPDRGRCRGACDEPVSLQVARLDIGLLFYFAISSLAVYGATLAGWASHNKWAMMGGLRASSQMMSYEVTMGMAVMGAFLVYGTLEPGAMVARRRSSSASTTSLELGHLPAAARLHPVPHRGDRRDQAHAVRHPRGRARDHRLLRRVLGHALRHVLPGRVPRDRHLERDHGHALLRRLALPAAASTAFLARARCRTSCSCWLTVRRSGP